MSSSSSSDKFNVQKWNDALLVGSKLVAKQLITNQVVSEASSDSTGWPSSLNEGIKLCVIFACDITAPTGTYPTPEESLKNGLYTFGMSRDIFDHFTFGATIVMSRFVAMVIKECNSIQTKLEFLLHSGFDSSHTTSDATVVSTYLYVRKKPTEVAQPQPGLLSWFRSRE